MKINPDILKRMIWQSHDPSPSKILLRLFSPALRGERSWTVSLIPRLPAPSCGSSGSSSSLVANLSSSMCLFSSLLPWAVSRGNFSSVKSSSSLAKFVLHFYYVLWSGSLRILSLRPILFSDLSDELTLLSCPRLLFKFNQKYAGTLHYSSLQS